MAVVLGVVGGVAGLALDGVKSMTDPVIEKRILEQKIKPTLDKYLKPVGMDNDYIADRVKLDLGKDEIGRRQHLNVFQGRKGGVVKAAALQTSGGGYGGDIHVLTVFDLENKTILGVKTLSQKETKGLGARIKDDSEAFIKQFSGMDYSGGIRFRSDGGRVDAISGATISSNAFTKAVNSAVELLAERSGEITEP